MFYTLSKTIYILGMPMTWLVLLILWALIAKGRRKNIILGFTFIFIYLCGTSQVINRLMLWWEVPPTPYAEITTPYDVGIVLAGPIKFGKKPKDRVHTHKGADRFLHAAELYHKGLIKTIIVTGGHKKVFDKLLNESEQIRKILVMSGVPDSVIISEPHAINTHENATKTAEILNRQFQGQRFLVITSAFHMRRSLACFKKAGIEADGFSTDFYTKTQPRNFNSYIPTALNFNTFNILVKEMMGFVIYKLVGYA